MQGTNGLQPTVNTIKLENPNYYCNSYTPPASDHAAMMTSGSYSKYSNSINIFNIPFVILMSLNYKTITDKANLLRFHLDFFFIYSIINISKI